MRSTAFFLRRCLKFEYLKRYVGGLVQFDGSTSHIDFLGFWPIMEGQLHCLNGHCFFGNDVHQTETVPFEQRDDVQRFERQG